MKDSLKFNNVKNDLLKLGIGITRDADYPEYRVNYINGSEASAYYTDCLEDAYSTGLLMASETKVKQG